MTRVSEPTPHRGDGPQHPEFEAAVAGGPLDSEGPGSAHRYRNVILGGIAILLFAMAMLTSYSSAFGNPTPNNVHLAVTGNADTIAALEAIDGKTFVPEHLKRAQPGRSSADYAVVAWRHADEYQRPAAREQEPIDCACRRHGLRYGTA